MKGWETNDEEICRLWAGRLDLNNHKNSSRSMMQTRHISISIDETAEQTRKIAKSYRRQTEGLSRQELRTWHMVQRLLEKQDGN